MNKFTQEFLENLLEKQNELNSMYEELRKYVYELGAWEKENLGIFHVTVDGTIIDVKVEGESIRIKAYDYDEYEEEYDVEDHWFPLHKLMSDDWKEAAIEKHRAELAEKEEKQRVKEAWLKEQKEAAERAEYERLKAKFENKGES